jgi:putative ABC transport system permease protein
MLKNYLIVALRSIRRNSLYAVMNVGGLAIGLAACILITLYIADELSFDRMHEDADRIYRVIEERTGVHGASQHFVYTMGPLGPALESSVPGVEETVRAMSAWSTGRRSIQRGDARFFVGNQLFTEPGFFDLFDFPFVAGDPEGALEEPFEVVLTEESALMYFGDENPIGQTLSVEFIGDFTVRGVVRVPQNTHVEYSMFFSFATMTSQEDWKNWLADWSTKRVMTYVRLAPGIDPAGIDQEMMRLVESHADEETRETRRPHLQALTDIHLGSSHIDFDENRGRGHAPYLYIFGVVAVFLVLIAAINYMNMATARSMRRAREIGLRKVVGAYRRQLIAQFLAESLLTSWMALVVALLLVRAALPAFNSFADKVLAVSFPVLLGSLVLASIVGILAGSYPALFLSKFQPASILKGSGDRRMGGARMREALVVAQFVMSIALIVATIVVQNQLEFVQSKRLGFEEQQLVVVDINDGRLRAGYASVKQEMAAVPGVVNVSVSNNVPGDWKNIAQVEIASTGEDALTRAHFFAVDEHFLETYRIELAEGRSFGGEFATDSTSVLLNETAARTLRLDVGDRLRIPAQAFEADVIGIVRDFHFMSLHQPIGPMVLGFRSNPIDLIDYFTVRISGENPLATIDGLRAVGERFDPDHPFELNFLDQRLMDFYTRETRVRQIFGASAALSILIACLGLFGLAAFTTEVRTKEIGVRKVLGASVTDIVSLLSRDLARLVVIAFVLAAPLAYLVMRWWLQDFAYRTDMGPSTFAAAGILAFVTAMATVSYHSIKAATADPVKNLRYE